MDILQEKINTLLMTLTESQRSLLQSKVKNTYPFNQFELIFVQMIELGILSFNEYYTIRNEYYNRNKYLHLFEVSPRTFGESWAQNHLHSLVPHFKKPSKELDYSYNGEYDLYLPSENEKFIKIEVKASRAVSTTDKGSKLSERALKTSSISNFDMNFQQIKPKCCDIFIFVAVWVNTIEYWILTSEEILQNKYYNDKQHRGNIGEGQLHFKKNNIRQFDQFRVEPENIYSTIKKITLTT